MPSGVTGEIKSIETHHTQMEYAEAGDNIGFNLEELTRNAIHRGDVIGSTDSPPNVAKEFEAQIIVIHHPTGYGTWIYSSFTCPYCTGCCYSFRVCCQN